MSIIYAFVFYGVLPPILAFADLDLIKSPIIGSFVVFINTKDPSQMDFIVHRTI